MQRQFVLIYEIMKLQEKSALEFGGFKIRGSDFTLIVTLHAALMLSRACLFYSR